MTSEQFTAFIEESLARATPLTEREERGLDRLLEMAKPHFEAAVARMVESGVLTRREQCCWCGAYEAQEVELRRTGGIVECVDDEACRRRRQ